MTYNEQLAAIIAEIAPVLKDAFDAETYAAHMIEEADDTDEPQHFEVRGFHTKSGNPHTFWIG